MLLADMEEKKQFHLSKANVDGTSGSGASE